MGASTVIPKYDSDIPGRHVFEWFLRLSRLFFPGNMGKSTVDIPARKSAAPTLPTFDAHSSRYSSNLSKIKLQKGLRKTQDAGLEDFRRRFGKPPIFLKKNVPEKRRGHFKREIPSLPKPPFFRGRVSVQGTPTSLLWKSPGWIEKSKFISLKNWKNDKFIGC